MGRRRLLAPLAGALGALLVTTSASAGTETPGGLQASIKVRPAPTTVVGGYGAVWVLSQGNVSYVTRIDPRTNRVTAIVRLGYGEVAGAFGFDPFASPISSGSGAVWVTDFFTNKLLRIDPTTATVDARISVGRSPTGVVAAFGDVFVANWQQASVSRVDPATNRVIATIPVGNSADFTGGPYSLALIDGELWATVPDGEQVVRIDPSTNSVTDVENVTPAPDCGELLPAPNGFWINDASCSNTVTRYDVSAHRVVASFTTGGCLVGATVRGDALYTAEIDFHPKSQSCSGGSLVERSLRTGQVLVRDELRKSVFGAFSVSGDLWTSNAIFGQGASVVYRVEPVRGG